MKLVWSFALLAVAGCGRADSPGASTADSKPSSSASTQVVSAVPRTLTEARRGFKTRLRTKIDGEPRDPVEVAPPQVFRTLKYPSTIGPLAAYLTPDPKDGQKHPAIIWITGGDCNSIGDVWSPQEANNDQSAAAYRKAGIVMMFPSLRGGNDNPGQKEGFLGEVDDVIAAADFLTKQSYVDPTRIYLGGHSTGGTLAMLVAESTPRFRGTFAFGPVDDVSLYGSDSGFLPFDLKNEEEVDMRSPGYWLSSLRSPLWAIEGTEGNIEALGVMSQGSTQPYVHFISVRGADHFATLAHTNALIARKILADKGRKSSLSLSTTEVNRLFAL